MKKRTRPIAKKWRVARSASRTTQSPAKPAVTMKVVGMVASTTLRRSNVRVANKAGSAAMKPKRHKIPNGSSAFAAGAIAFTISGVTSRKLIRSSPFVIRSPYLSTLQPPTLPKLQFLTGGVIVVTGRAETRSSAPAGHHGCRLACDVTTMSRSQREQRQWSWASGTSPRPLSMSACRSASRCCWHDRHVNSTRGARSVVRGVGRPASSGLALTGRRSPPSPAPDAPADGISCSASRRAAPAPSTSAAHGRRCTMCLAAAAGRCPPSWADAVGQKVRAGRAVIGSEPKETSRFATIRQR